MTITDLAYGLSALVGAGIIGVHGATAALMLATCGLLLAAPA